jgi:uncharacterized membrane protein YqjE
VSDETPGAAPEPGLRGALARLAAAAVALVGTRVELASIEFAEERERARDRLILVAVALTGFGFALLAASAFVVVLFWEAHRLEAIAGVCLFYLAVGGIAAWKLAAGRGNAPAPFAGTLAELERDREWLSRRMGGES